MGLPSFWHSFWPSFSAPAGHSSTQRPQATHFSLSTRAVKELLDMLGVLYRRLVLRALQICTLQLQISKM